MAKAVFLLMLTIKKIFFLFQFLMVLTTSFSAFHVLANKNSLVTQENIISQVEYLFQQNADALDYEQVINLSNQIIPKQNQYTNEIIAKTYLLLASIALNKGELETAFQFTQDGLAKTNPNHKAQLCLHIKLAEVLSAKKDYKKLLTIAEKAIKSPNAEENIRYLLFALSYRSIAFSMLSQHSNALADLEKIENTIQANPAFSEHISLLSILANANYNLGKFQTALTLQLKILTLRFNLKQLGNIDQTYYQLGNAYFYLHKYDDAYNAYWEAKKYAEKKGAPIYIAYAKQGLASTLHQQKQYSKAKIELLQAKTIFHQHGLTRPYLETLINLAQISKENQQLAESFAYLKEAEEISAYTPISHNYIAFYQLLAHMYFIENRPEKAYLWQKKYSLALENIKYTKRSIKTEDADNQSLLDSSKNQNLAVRLAEKSELASVFSAKYKNQKHIIFILFFILVCVLFSGIFIWIKQRKKHSSSLYDAQESTDDIISDPMKTKQFYQTHFNMARKYSYPLTLGYIVITNWKELSFQFNKSVVEEVESGIADLMHDNIDEFDTVGLINVGEYLLFFPHQSQEAAKVTMDKILQALQLRFFANLGEFSVTLSHSIKTPDFQDIDPYIFLSQLSSAIKST